MPGAVEIAIAGVLAKYAALSKTDGYSVDVKYATRHPQVLRGLTSNQVPAVCVARVPGGSGGITYMGSETYKQKIRLAVLLFIRGNGTNPDTFGLATAAEAGVSDLKALQLKDPTFGTAEIRDSLLLDDDNDAGWADDGAIASIEFNATVVWNATAPP